MELVTYKLRKSCDVYTGPVSEFSDSDSTRKAVIFAIQVGNVPERRVCIMWLTQIQTVLVSVVRCYVRYCTYKFVSCLISHSVVGIVPEMFVKPAALHISQCVCVCVCVCVCKYASQ
jgi:hypothetical protein